MATQQAKSTGKTDYAPPPIEGDFYRIAAVLNDGERTLLKRVREFTEGVIAPVIEDYWSRDAFPFEIIPKMAEVGIGGVGYQGYGAAGGSWLLNGPCRDGVGACRCVGRDVLGRAHGPFGRIDLSVRGRAAEATLAAAHDALRQDRLVRLDGAASRVGDIRWNDDDMPPRGRQLDPQRSEEMDRQRHIRRHQRDLAREEGSNQVKGFVVGKDNPGFSVEKIKTKMALRVVQNGLITLSDCCVPEADRLQNANSFKDTAKVLRMTRTGVAWFAVGCQMGAYEHALRYATERTQFGRPIGGFQLVQDLLVRMLGNVTSTQAMMLRLAQLQDEDVMRDEHASLAKAFCTVKCRETVGYARELLGGNGILLENHIGRFVADAEAIYSYEGTREMNTLIVGKSITGLSAFV